MGEEKNEVTPLEEWTDEELYGKAFAILDVLSARYYPGRKPTVAKAFAGRLDTQPKMCFEEALPQVAKMFNGFQVRDKGNYSMLKRYAKEMKRRGLREKPLEPSDFYLYFYKEKNQLWRPNENNLANQSN